MKKTITFALFICLGLSLNAQYQWELGSFVGVASYQGDFSTTPVPRLKNSSFGFGIISRYVLNYKWSLRSGIYVASLKGDDLVSDDPWRENTRRAAFSTRLTEVSLIAELEPFGEQRYLGGRGFKKLVSPYFFSGIGLSFIKPKPDFSETKGSANYKINIEQDKNAQYFNTRITIPLGVGVKFDLSEFWNIGFEVGARYPFTDYLDGLSEAGNPKANDWYYFSGVTVLHRLSGSMKR